VRRRGRERRVDTTRSGVRRAARLSVNALVCSTKSSTISLQGALLYPCKATSPAHSHLIVGVCLPIDKGGCSVGLKRGLALGGVSVCAVAPEASEGLANNPLRVGVCCRLTKVAPQPDWKRAFAPFIITCFCCVSGVTVCAVAPEASEGLAAAVCAAPHSRGARVGGLRRTR
jgi:hypothetical protein